MVNACIVDNYINALIGRNENCQFLDVNKRSCQMEANLVLSENEGNSSSDALITGDIYCKQLGGVDDRFNLHATAGGAIHVSSGKLLG